MYVLNFSDDWNLNIRCHWKCLQLCRLDFIASVAEKDKVKDIDNCSRILGEVVITLKERETVGDLSPQSEMESQSVLNLIIQTARYERS